MYSAVNELKGIIKIGTLITDNAVFKLHYQLTCLILIVFSVIVSTNQFFGDPIDCFTSMADEVPGDNVLDNYCWIHSTFTLPGSMNKKVGTDVIYPGVDKATPDQEKTYHSYYQWVCFFLFFQAVLFYIPRYLWKIIEGGKIRGILLGLNSAIFEDESYKDSKLNKLAAYMESTFGGHTFYAMGLVFCEILNFVNVVGQIYFTNAFLGGEFTTYGTEVIQFSQMDQYNRTDPMIEVFPRMTKCTFRKFGPSGDIQTHDALCVLPINIINEKIFIFLWFWFILLSIVSGLVLVYRIVLVFCKNARCCVLACRCNGVDKFLLKNLVIKSEYGDWFLLNMMCKNVNAIHYKNFIEELSRQLGIVNGAYQCALIKKDNV